MPLHATYIVHAWVEGVEIETRSRTAASATAATESKRSEEYTYKLPRREAKRVTITARAEIISMDSGGEHDNADHTAIVKNGS
jgi:hypothetical protein